MPRAHLGTGLAGPRWLLNGPQPPGAIFTVLGFGVGHVTPILHPLPWGEDGRNNTCQGHIWAPVWRALDGYLMVLNDLRPSSGFLNFGWASYPGYQQKAGVLAQFLSSIKNQEHFSNLTFRVESNDFCFQKLNRSS